MNFDGQDAKFLGRVEAQVAGKSVQRVRLGPLRDVDEADRLTPKVRALEIIDELEREKRGIYGETTDDEAEAQIHHRGRDDERPHRAARRVLRCAEHRGAIDVGRRSARRRHQRGRIAAGARGRHRAR